MQTDTAVRERKLVVGNWKMNGDRSALPLVAAINDGARDHPTVEVGLAVPATLLIPAWLAAGAIKIGAQDIHAADKGPHTGCVSANMVRDAGGAFTLVGHSECRARGGETNLEVRAKAEAAHRHGLQVILCVGEPLAEREAGRAEIFVRDQLLESLPANAEGVWLTIAYEPIWAIGTGAVPSPADIAAMHRNLRETCRERLGKAGDNMRLLYGGSVSAHNAQAILQTPDVDGVLVGGASLMVESFMPIVAGAGRRETATA